MAWYWIVALCAASSLAGWYMAMLMRSDDVAQEMFSERNRMAELYQHERERCATQAETIALLQEEVAQGREAEARIADALHGREVR